MNKYSGSNFDDFLDEEGILEEVSERAQKQLLALQIQDIIDDSLNKEDMPEEISARVPNMKASNHRLFDLDATSITLEWLNHFAPMMQQPNHRLFDPDNTSIALESLNRLQQMAGLANQPATVEFLRQEAGGGVKMKFFVPAAKDEIEAQSVWKATKKFAEETLGWKVSERRIFSIAYRHDGKDYYVEVGNPDPRIGELVLVILESNTYLVCTPNRGVLRGMPILVGQNEVKRITDFLEHS